MYSGAEDSKIVIWNRHTLKEKGFMKIDSDWVLCVIVIGDTVWTSEKCARRVQCAFGLSRGAVC